MADLVICSGMKQELWAKLIKNLPPNLTAEKAARIFRRSVTLTRRRLIENGYKVKLARKNGLPEWASKANWRLANIDIARKYNVTRERVRKYRIKLGKPFVEARGRKYNGQGRSL